MRSGVSLVKENTCLASEAQGRVVASLANQPLTRKVYARGYYLVATNNYWRSYAYQSNWPDYFVSSQWPTTATNGRVESHNACWLEIPLASCNHVVSLQCSYLSLQYSYTNSTNPGAVRSKPPLIKLHDKFVQTSDSLTATTSKTSTKKQPDAIFEHVPCPPEPGGGWNKLSFIFIKAPVFLRTP